MSNEIKYFVNESKGVVVAKLSNLREELYSTIIKLEGLSVEDAFDIVMKYPDELSAKAICDERDTFSLDAGIELAKRKLLVKVLNNRRKAAHEVVLLFMNRMYNAYNLANKADEAYENAVINLVNLEDIL